MGHVFISYSHKDSEYVHKLADALQNEGFEVWIDDRIHYGSEWPKVVTANLDSSDGVIVVLSNNSYESDMVQNEVTRAREKKKPIFPLLLEGENWLIVQAKQFVDVRDNSLPTEKFYKRLEGVTTRKKVEDESVEKITHEKAKRDSSEKAAQDKAERKLKREFQKVVDNAQRDVRAIAKRSRRRKFLIGVQSRLNSFFINVRYDFLPVFFALFALVGIAYFLFYAFRYFPKTNQALPSTSTSFSLQTPKSIFPTLPSSETPQPSATSIQSFTLTPTSLPTEITDTKDVPMLLVPAGNFIMGSNNGSADELPVHTVYLNTFYMDKYEVTNALYKTCVGTGTCSPPSYSSAPYHSSYFGNPVYDNYPVVYVDWEQAKLYCKWRGARLPTEAEWEKAARGDDSRTYPWGEGIDCNRANYWGCKRNFLTPVGIYESGKSPYGLYDMAGNVWEWVSDLYSATYYAELPTPIENPLGPSTGIMCENGMGGDCPVLRGGSWMDTDYYLRSAERGKRVYFYGKPNVGFRCARSAQ